MTLKLPTKEVLRRLGAGQTIASVCEATGISRQTLDAWWKHQTKSRVPAPDGEQRAPVQDRVEIARDEHGIPHILAQNDQDLFFGYGYAIAQDRLWQLDYLRRKAMGRLAEILGPEAVELDLTARTVGIGRIAARELEHLTTETAKLLSAFSDGINAFLETARDKLPIEFDLLDYQPEPWSPIDSLAIMGEFRWYLTGRFPVIAIPELARRTLGAGPLYHAFLTPEADQESILPAGSYPASPGGEEPVGRVVGDPQEGEGSNNWVLEGSRTTTGSPLLASDPHIAFGALSCWYEVHLCGGSFNVAGMAYVGVPSVMFGRNERVAWGITNNICSQRDLFQERTTPDQPGCFLYDGQWEPARELTQVIQVKGGEPIHQTVRFSRNGPIVDEILPEVAKHTGPVSLRWLGATLCDELSCMVAYNRAGSCDEFRAALRNWRVPTFSIVFADVDGHIGYQATGRIPIRHSWHGGYRSGFHAGDRWNGLVPFEGMPALSDPECGWIRTANNRTAPEDYPYPLSGCWSSGYRARRIRNMLERSKLSREDCVAMQHDLLSLRAAQVVPRLLSALEGVADQRVQQASAYLRSWDCRMTPDSVAATLFEVFFESWTREVAAERFAAEAVDFVAGAIWGLAVRLLSGDDVGWFAQGGVPGRVVETLRRVLDEVTGRLGPDMAQWTWGRLHTLTLRHPLSGRGDLAELLDRGDPPAGGSQVTVCNVGYGPDYRVTAGANYRMVVDMTELGLWASAAGGQSGHPGSVHYCDQLAPWLSADYHFVPLDRHQVDAGTRARFTLHPLRPQ